MPIDDPCPTVFETGLSLDNVNVQSDLAVDITLTYKNASGSHEVPLGSKQVAKALYGLLTRVVVDGKGPYAFGFFQTVQPTTTVNLDLDQDLMNASFMNVLGEMVTVTFVKPKESSSGGVCFT
jgi:hypothetical protein